VGFRIAGNDEPSRLRHGRKMSIEIPSRDPDESTALYALASFQHRHWNALAHELVRGHRPCRTTAYDNHAAIVTHAIPSKLLRLACLASFGRGRYGVLGSRPRFRNPIMVK